MRKKILTFAVVLLVFIVSFDGCKKADTETYALTVIVSEGVSGSPVSGVYDLEKESPLPYSYVLTPGYSKLTVLLDGTAIAASGTLTLSEDHTLQAYADDNIQYALTVTLTDGVSGTPGAGTSNHPQGSLVDYSYTVQEGYYDLTVLLDNQAVENSGTIAMTANHKLTVRATLGKNIRGTWVLNEIYSDGSAFSVTAIFSGELNAGTVTDSDGGSGTYTFTGATVAFNLVFPDVTYEYTGNFSDNDTMKGTCKRYKAADNIISGNWLATRKTAAASDPRPAGAGAAAGKGDGRKIK